MGADRDILVVGAGIIGLACAFQLSRGRHRITVLDEGTASPPASWGNAGHIAVEQVEPLASRKTLSAAPARLFHRGGPLDVRAADVAAWAPWALRVIHASDPARFRAGREALSRLLSDALPAWRRLVLALGHPELLREEGHYVLWESPSTSAAGRAVWERTDIGEARMAALDAGALERIAALLHRPPAGGVRFTGTGQISDPGLALEALRTAVIAQGGRFRQARVHRLQEREGRASLELVDGERLDADTILVAAGVGSGPLMRSVGHLAPLIAERGYHLEGEAAGWPEPLPPIVFEDRFLIVTRFGARLRATSFVELARHGSPPDPRKWARLERHVEELGLPMGAPRGRWMGSRPTLPDYLPAIGVSRRASNLIYAFGHQHLGLTLAATTGEIIAALLGEAIPPTEVSAFALERFEAAGSRSRNRRGDPRARIAA